MVKSLVESIVRVLFLILGLRILYSFDRTEYTIE